MASEANSVPPVPQAAEPAPPASDITNHTNNEQGVKRKRQPRNSACQSCATTKIKCIPGPVEGGACERCHRMNKQCLPAVPKARKRRTDGDGEMVQRFSGQSPEAPVSLVAAATTRHSLPNPYVPDGTQSGLTRTPLDNADLCHSGSPSFKQLFIEGLCLDSKSSAAEMLYDCVDHSFVRNRLNVFRQFAVRFPFVDLPHSDPVILIAELPVLVLAMITITAVDSPPHRQGFAQAFRQALSTKVIVNGERSMDLFLGLMVFMAWHHHYMEKHQIFQELCLLSGMAADLGIDDMPASNLEQTATELQKHKAFLGCYYLCCGLATMGFNRPSPLRWSASLQQRALLLHSYSHGSPDVLPLVEVMHAMEDLDDVLTTEPDTRASASTGYQELQTKVATQRLRNLKLSFPALNNLPTFAAVSIHINQRILRASNNPDTSTLIQCACAIKEYIDDLLSRPPILLHQIAAVEWTNLLEILLLTVRISKPLPQAAGWEAGAIASMLQPETLLDGVCAHMASAPSGDPLAPRDDVLLRWFQRLCESIKLRIRAERNGGESSAVLKDNASHFDAVVGGIGREGEGVNGRFRAVNEEERPPAAQMSQPANAATAGGRDFLDLFRHGILDESFWFASGL